MVKVAVPYQSHDICSGSGLFSGLSFTLRASFPYPDLGPYFFLPLSRSLSLSCTKSWPLPRYLMRMRSTSPSGSSTLHVSYSRSLSLSMRSSNLHVSYSRPLSLSHYFFISEVLRHARFLCQLTSCRFWSLFLFFDSFPISIPFSVPFTIPISFPFALPISVSVVFFLTASVSLCHPLSIARSFFCIVFIPCSFSDMVSVSVW